MSDKKNTSTFINVVKLIRWPNLLIIALAMALVQYTIINPILNYNSLPIMHSGVFVLLVLSTVLLAAGGYVINDILDVKIDLINKPQKVIVGKKYPLSLCWELYWVCTVIGVLAMLIACWYNHTFYMATIAAFEAALLWFYSSVLKKLPLIGNVSISILCALALLKPMLLHQPAYATSGIIFLVLGYVLFAFILTLIRELIKTCEDVHGDSAMGAQTAAVFFGVTATKIIAAVLTLTCMVSVGWFMWQQWLSETFWTNDFISFGYVALFVQLPLLLLLYKLFTAKNTPQFTTASMVAKIVMVTGIFSMLVFYWVLFI
ncbi:MAG: geranylgeranylglycerol-phosphate geranylgeranyltransferase [Bacteroidia bacterium]|nr:geranylgeranylglycerol-phosphate geranylgeranyltransferase [Bacteroidia bacterium]